MEVEKRKFTFYPVGINRYIISQTVNSQVMDDMEKENNNTEKIKIHYDLVFPKVQYEQAFMLNSHISKNEKGGNILQVYNNRFIERSTRRSLKSKISEKVIEFNDNSAEFSLDEIKKELEVVDKDALDRDMQSIECRVLCKMSADSNVLHMRKYKKKELKHGFYDVTDYVVDKERGKKYVVNFDYYIDYKKKTQPISNLVNELKLDKDDSNSKEGVVENIFKKYFVFDDDKSKLIMNIKELINSYRRTVCFGGNFKRSEKINSKKNSMELIKSLGSNNLSVIEEEDEEEGANKVEKSSIKSWYDSNLLDKSVNTASGFVYSADKDQKSNKRSSKDRESDNENIVNSDEDTLASNFKFQTYHSNYDAVDEIKSSKDNRGMTGSIIGDKNMSKEYLPVLDNDALDQSQQRQSLQFENINSNRELPFLKFKSIKNNVEVTKFFNWNSESNVFLCSKIDISNNHGRQRFEFDFVDQSSCIRSIYDGQGNILYKQVFEGERLAAFDIESFELKLQSVEEYKTNHKLGDFIEKNNMQVIDVKEREDLMLKVDCNFDQHEVSNMEGNTSQDKEFDFFDIDKVEIVNINQENAEDIDQENIGDGDQENGEVIDCGLINDNAYKYIALEIE
ncbi:MAG: hypothetical protein AAFO15_00600 [Pseudomonadota bacterium]